MGSEGPGLDEQLDDMGQLDDPFAGGDLSGPQGATDDGFDNYDGFDNSTGGTGTFAGLDKQEAAVGSGFSNAPTSAPPTQPPTARDDRDPHGLTMGSMGDWGKTMGSTTDWSKRVHKPENSAQWEANTHEHLSHAKMLIQKAQAHQQENDRNIHVGSKRQKDKTGVVTNFIKKKMSMTNDLIKALEDRHESVEDTIRQVGECLFQLQRAHRSKWAPLNVCERRLELRDTRPLPELVRDHTQEALEHERQTLIESRQELLDQVASSKETLINLDMLKMEVIQDLSHKRHGLRIDRTCLSGNKSQIGGTSNQDRVVLPQLGEVANYNLPSSPGKEPDRGSPGGYTDDNKKKEKNTDDTKTLLHKAVRMEEDAMRLCNESDSIMLQTKRECQMASTQAQTSIARRADETDDLKRKLETQMREIDEAIAQTEMSLGRTKKKLESHEGPLRALDKQFEMRGKQNSSNDGQRDPVHEEMEAHLETVKKSVRTLKQKQENTSQLLDQLKQSRQLLTEDYRGKLLSLKIEDACLKVTPRKAMELDRMDPRGGRCKVPSAKRTVKKEGVYSLVASMPIDMMEEQVNLANNDF